MRGFYSNFQVLFLGLLGLIMIGGHNFGAESYEILDTTPDIAPIEVAELPHSPRNVAISTITTKTPATAAKIKASQAKTTQKTTTVKKSSTPIVKTAIAVATPDQITIGGRTIRIKSVSDTTINAGSMVAKYGDKFFYGHNTNTVFSHLRTLGTGTTFTVTLGGQTTTYQIAKAVTLEKQTQVAPIMRAIANAQIYGQTYDLSIMTCAGTSYGNGDASHRLIIFANRI